MKDKRCGRTQKGHGLIKVIGIMALALLMLVSLAGAEPFAYITNWGSSTVSIIDTATGSVTATVNVGTNPLGVAVAPDGSKVYIGNVGSDSVSVIDTETNTVTATVNVGDSPYGVSASPDGTKVYVANYGGNTISVIDATTSTVTATVTLGNHPLGVAASPDGTKVYVTTDIDRTVYVIDTATDTIIAEVYLENQYPGGVAVNPDGSKVYVTSGGTDNVSVIDTASYTVTATVPVGDRPTGVTVTGTKAYVANYGSNTVSVIDTATNTVTTTVSVGSSPYGVAVAPDGTEVYVANSHSNTVSVIDTATDTITSIVSVETTPKALGQFIGPLPKPELLDPSDIYIIRITTSGSASDPHVYGDRVVYQDTRNGNADIYMYDLSAQKETQISTSGTAQYPAISGNRIVWKDNRNGKSDIYMYDLSTSQETQISTSGSVYSDESERSGPDIYNDRIVWQESYYTDLTTYCLIVYDLSTQQETQIAEIVYSMEPYADSFDFAIHGDKIVYNYCAIDDYPPFIDMYDLSTQQTTSLGAGDAPDIYGNRIVWVGNSWEGDPNGPYYYYYPDIYMYDLSTQQLTQASTSGKAHNPAIYNNRIVWEDDLDGQNINMYDLPNSKENRITASGSAYSPDIYGDRIVWVDGNDIYVGTLNPVSPVADFSSNVTEGYAPLTVLFTDLSENTTAWNWDFGDGVTSTEQNPVHTYSTAGNYTVNLTVSNEYGTDSKNSAITVLEQPSNEGAAPFAYITNSEDDTVSVINTALDKVIAIVDVGDSPGGVAVTPDGSKVYVTNENSNTVSVIDSATNTVIAIVPVGVGAYGVAITPDGTKVYVVNRDEVNWASNDVSVIDTATNTVVSTVPVGLVPVGVAVSPDGAKVYVTNGASNTLSVIDTATNIVKANVSVGNMPWGVAVSPDGTKVYVVNKGSNNVSVIDTATDSVIATVDVGSWPEGIVFTPDGTKVYVSNSVSPGTISVIDTATNTVTAMVSVGSNPKGVAVTPDGTKIYVTNYGSNTVSIIDTATNTVTATIDVGSGPVAFGQFIGTPPSQPLVFPVAKFTSNATCGFTTLTVSFTDSSIGLPTAWNWDFGDGATSIEQNPVHTYSAVGTYIVNLTVSNSNGTDSKLATIKVLTPDQEAGMLTKVASNVSDYSNPVWSPSGNEILFARDDGLYKVSSDGSGEKKLASGPISQYTWSPDGSKISYVEHYIPYSSSSPPRGHWVMNSDGTEKIQLPYEYFGEYFSYTWFPSGSKIFCVDCLYIADEWTASYKTINPDGSNLQYLGGLEGAIWSIALSPDASKVAFDTWPGVTILSLDENSQVSFNLDGISSLVRQTQSWQPQVWSPDGSKIVYSNRNIYTINADGTGKTQLTAEAANENSPVFSPDGSKIVFVSDEAGTNDILIMDADGNNNVHLTTDTASNDGYPVWSPDGTKIAFWSDREGDYGIYTLTLKTPLLAFPGYTNPPTDLDQNGLYEDINGNGMLDFDDVVAYYDNMEWIEANMPLDLFDYNDNGLIDFDDVVKLYDML